MAGEISQQLRVYATLPKGLSSVLSVDVMWLTAAYTPALGGTDASDFHGHAPAHVCTYQSPHRHIHVHAI